MHDYPFGQGGKVQRAGGTSRNLFFTNFFPRLQVLIKRDNPVKHPDHKDEDEPQVTDSSYSIHERSKATYD